MFANISAFLYLVSAICFIIALKGLTGADTARRGNFYAMTGMAIAILTALASPQVHTYGLSIAMLVLGGGTGFAIASRLKMTALPQLMAGFHSLVGLSAVLVAAAALYSPQTFLIGLPGKINPTNLIEMGIGCIIGAITFAGSIVAFLKLQGIIGSTPLFPLRQIQVATTIGFVVVILLLVQFCATGYPTVFWLLTLLSLVIGVGLILPVGGADMPVIVSMLNSYSGWAAAGIGFALSNYLLLITGAIVGVSGAILSYIMCKAMNRSLFQVILGGMGQQSCDTPHAGDIVLQGDEPVKIVDSGEVAQVLLKAKSIIIIPGYGMAVAQAQHTLKQMVDTLKQRGILVRYAIHPVAGRMPGHMNVLLAEANVPYDDIVELSQINDDFSQTDVAFVIGANDITNPAAKNNPKSPIYGMAVCDVDLAKAVVFVKRSLASGYAGIDNELFVHDNTLMLLGDAKKVCDHLRDDLDKLL